MGNGDCQPGRDVSVDFLAPAHGVCRTGELGVWPGAPRGRSESMRQLGWVVLVGLLVRPVGGQERLPFQFFDCGTVRFFEAACVPAPDATAPGAAPGGQAPAVAPSLRPPTPPGPPPLAAPADALFTPETVAPTTPSVLLRLLQEPTEGNARAFLAWHQAQLARLQAVQALLQRLGQERNEPGAIGKE